jgi:hypothetical protein
MRTKEEWETLFRKIGAEDPESCAASEVEGKHGNLTKLAFLRGLWKLVPDKEDQFWLKRWIAYEATTQPEASAAYTRLLNSGANNEDLLLLLRGVTSEFLFQTAALLEAGQTHDLEDEIAEQIQWRFCEVDEDGTLVPLSGFHELLDAGDSNEH